MRTKTHDTQVAALSELLGIPAGGVLRDYRHMLAVPDAAPDDQAVLEAHFFSGISRDLSKVRTDSDSREWWAEIHACDSIDRVVPRMADLTTVRLTTRRAALRVAALVGWPQLDDAVLLPGRLDVTADGLFVRYGAGTLELTFSDGPPLAADEIRAEQHDIADPEPRPGPLPEADQWLHPDVTEQARAASLIFRRLDAVRGARHRPTAVEYWDGRIEISPSWPGMWDLLDVLAVLEATSTASIATERRLSPTVGDVTIDGVEFYITVLLPLAENALFTEQQRRVGERILALNPGFGTLEYAVAANRLDAEGRPR